MLALEVERLAMQIEAQSDVIADLVFARAQAEFPEFARLDDPQLARAFRRSAETNIRASLARLGAGLEVPAEAPADTHLLARLWAQAGLPVSALTRSYAFAHATVWEFFADAIESAELSPQLRRFAIREVSHFLFAFADQGGLHATRAFEVAREARVRSREQRTLERVVQILAGDDSAANQLRYDLSRQHVAFVAWGPGATSVAAALKARFTHRFLSVQPDEQTIWGWLGGFEELDRREKRQLGEFSPEEPNFVAFGPAATGADGFRATHRRARRAQTIGARLARPVTHYKDVALEALASGHEELAREFVQDELGDLAGQDARSRKLRDTLSAYFATSSNAAAAASALGVHDQTVSYRLRTIEDQLGVAVGARRVELEVALRLNRLLQTH